MSHDDDKSNIHYSLWICCGLYALYKVYRELEIRRIGCLAEHFVVHGYVCISGVKPARKKAVWSHLLYNHFFGYWQGRHPNMTRDCPLTWPCDPSGKTYEDNLTDSIDGTPLLYTENYEAQAILCFLMSSRLRHVTFGKQSHWRLKLLIDPLWSLGFSRSPDDNTSITLGGDDQAWHIVNWPAPDLPHPEAVPNGGHIDSGPDAILTRGIPPPLRIDMCHSRVDNGECTATVNDTPSTTELALLSLLLHQLAILYYCETPGVLGPQEGMTGIVRSSHIILLEALRQRLALVMSSDQHNSHSLTPCVPWEDLDGSGSGVRMSLKRWCDSAPARSRLVQPSISEGEAVLCMGWVVHTAMRPTCPMVSIAAPHRPLPRVIQNAKSFVQWRKHNRTLDDNEGVVLAERTCHIISVLKKQSSSLAWNLLRDPVQCLRNVSGAQEQDEEIKSIKLEAGNLYNMFAICT